MGNLDIMLSKNIDFLIIYVNSMGNQCRSIKNTDFL